MNRIQVSRFLPPSLMLLLKRLGLVFLLLTVSRLVFYGFNRVYFQEASPMAFLLGLRFDASIVAYFFSLFILLSLLPVSLYHFKIYRWVLAFFYFVPLTVVLLLNLSDAVYFRFIFRRSTFDVIRYFDTPSADGWRLLSTFIVDFWYIPVVLILLLIATAWAYQRAMLRFNSSSEHWMTRTLALLLAVGLIVLGGRGGLQLVPITLVDAGMYTAPSNMPLVLNTPFSIMTTAFQNKQEPIYFYTKADAEQKFSMNYHVKPYTPRTYKGKNVVVFILESFGQEYTGYYTHTQGYTPFLDSLLRQSYVFINAFSNGKQSVDAVPAIISGIPALLQEPFNESVYAANRIPSLGTYFDQQGYHTQFFHGGVNGTMGFEAFTQSAGIQDYYGKSQYPEPQRDYDGNWGISDEPYLQYFAHELSKNDKPFFSVLFTLSSHHPYSIPKKYEGKFPKGTYEIHESIGYADYALQQFFKEAKKQPWYKNTLFVLTADHTAQSEKPFYQQGMGMYAVPIAFYDPSSPWVGMDSTVIQHLDLFPTLVSLTGGDVKGKFFGRNVFDAEAHHEALNYNYGGRYYYYRYRDSLQYYFQEKEIAGIYRYPKDSSMSDNLLGRPEFPKESQEAYIKAKIQAYYQNMEDNSWWKEE